MARVVERAGLGQPEATLLLTGARRSPGRRDLGSLLGGMSGLQGERRILFYLSWLWVSLANLYIQYCHPCTPPMRHTYHCHKVWPPMRSGNEATRRQVHAYKGCAHRAQRIQAQRCLAQGCHRRHLRTACKPAASRAPHRTAVWSPAGSTADPPRTPCTPPPAARGAGRPDPPPANPSIVG